MKGNSSSEGGRFRLAKPLSTTAAEVPVFGQHKQLRHKSTQDIQNEINKKEMILLDGSFINSMPDKGEKLKERLVILRNELKRRMLNISKSQNNAAKHANKKSKIIVKQLNSVK